MLLLGNEVSYVNPHPNILKRDCLLTYSNSFHSKVRIIAHLSPFVMIHVLQLVVVRLAYILAVFVTNIGQIVSEIMGIAHHSKFLNRMISLLISRHQKGNTKMKVKELHIW
jgi:hypothetical protein